MLKMFSWRHRAAVLITLIILISGSGCVYYNTFFHARQKFNQAEKSQKGNQERLGQTAPAPGNPTGQRQPGTVPQKQTGDQTSMKINSQERVLYEDAIKKANKVLQYHPNSKWADDALWLIGKSYFNMSDYLLADRKFKELVINHPKSKFADESYYYMGLCQMFLGHNDQALSAFASLEDANKKSPYIEDMLFAKGTMEMLAENYPQAGEYFSEYAEKYPKGDSSARAMFDLGLCAEKQGDFPAALKAYSSVEKYDPDKSLYFDATLAAASAALKGDSVTLGMNILDHLARDERFFTRSGEIRLRVAEGQYRQGDIDKAIETYNEIISANPKTSQSAEAYYKLGLIYQNDQFDMAAAKDAFTKAQQEAPNSEYKGLALARSAQIAKLESYQAQLQRADSLRWADSLAAADGNPVVPPQAPSSPDTVGATMPKVDSSRVESGPDTSMITGATPENRSAPADTQAALIDQTDSTTSAALTDSTYRQEGPGDSLGLAGEVPGDSLRSNRMMRLLMAGMGDTTAQTTSGPADTVILGLQDTTAQTLPTPPVSAPVQAGQAPVNQDSVRAAILQAGIETRFLLSELYAYELNRPDSAINEYLQIAKEHPGSPYAPRSLLAAAQVELNRGDTAAAAQHLRHVVDEYPDSPQAARAAELLGSPLNLTDNALGLYAAAESLVFFGDNPDSALALFRYIAGKYPDLAPQASFAVAWILDRVKGVEDSSAYQAYASITRKYPETAYAKAASERLGLASNQSARRTPPKPSQQTQNEPSPSTGGETPADTSDQLVAGDLAPAPPTKRLEKFVYPEALLSRDLKGKVIFKIRLDISGMVRDYELIGPSGEPAIDSSATASLVRTEFDVSQLDLSQLDNYFRYSITFERPKIDIFNDPYQEIRDRGGH